MSRSTPIPSDPKIISYLTIRKVVGFIGIGIPVVLPLGNLVKDGCHTILSSISAYYHTGVHDLFVGLLFAIALFLFAYRGYDKKDVVAGNLGALLAVCIAFFPTSIEQTVSGCIPEKINTGISNTMHFIAAGGFFLVLAYFSLILFTRDDGRPTEMKLKRNVVYRACGIIMLSCILIIGGKSILDHFRPENLLQRLHGTFWLESLALWAFGISWITKGKTLLTDR